MFLKIYVPNSDEQYRRLREEFLGISIINSFVCIEAITVEMVEEACKNLKFGKAAAVDDLTLEHIIYSDKILIIHLKLLFNNPPLHGLMHDYFWIWHYNSSIKRY